MELTANRLREILHYNSETGVFTWIKAPKGRKSGDIAGTKCRGYIRIGIDKKLYAAHRLAWMYKNGIFPCGEIDHINRNRSDNRFLNLRECTRSINCINKSHPVGCSGITGVYQVKKTGRWAAVIQTNGNRARLGTFLTKDEAKSAYEKADAARQ